jgi:ribosomal protein S21
MLRIIIKKNNIEQGLRDYKSKIIKTRQMRFINKHVEFVSKSIKRREIINKAKYKQKYFS